MYLPLCLCLLLVLCIKAHVRKRKGKAQDGPHGCLLCSFSQAEEGQYGNCFQLQSLQIFPDSVSASSTARMGLYGAQISSRAQSVDAKQSNYNSWPNCRTHSPLQGLDSPSQDHYVASVLLSAVVETLKIGIKSYRAPGTMSRAAEMTHRHVITTLIRLSGSFKAVLVSEFSNFSKVLSTQDHIQVKPLKLWRRNNVFNGD